MAATRGDDSEAVLVATENGIALVPAARCLRAAEPPERVVEGYAPSGVHGGQHPGRASNRVASSGEPEFPERARGRPGDLRNCLRTLRQSCLPDRQPRPGFPRADRRYGLDIQRLRQRRRRRDTGSARGLRARPRTRDQRAHAFLKPAQRLVHRPRAWDAGLVRQRGRVQSVPALADGRLYVASLSGGLHVFDAATGTAYWSLDLGVPVQVDPVAVKLNGGEVVLAVVDVFGEIHVIRDEGTNGNVVAAFQLPTGSLATGAPGPAIAAVSAIVADAAGRALVGADDGKLYPIDLLAGTVGTPIDVDATSSEVTEVVLEPPGLFSSPASVLVGSSAGTLARYCTEVGAAACSNGVDDDGDGLTDFPDDPGCATADDLHEGE
ncbi:MAG: PQQ-binding-like beta-propeller repeat protein [Halioglobus sp.]|nr:PQQ-binding-like beta-propeller repeat protein [Halioglobus sp.]